MKIRDQPIFITDNLHVYMPDNRYAGPAFIVLFPSCTHSSLLYFFSLCKVTSLRHDLTDYWTLFRGAKLKRQIKRLCNAPHLCITGSCVKLSLVISCFTFEQVLNGGLACNSQFIGGFDIRFCKIHKYQGEYLSNRLSVNLLQLFWMS